MPANSVQVITDDLNYVNFIDQYIHETEMNKVGTNYKSIAIIGCQSSGKSTLLNILFDTDFEELNQSNKGMAQTTKGIWVAHNGDKNILIYDIEGTDSRERGDERLTFEQTTSLFALAMADVLMINMWTQDVGRYTASNYGLLKVIFEVNLKLFAQNQSQKKLIFILRDFNKHEHNKEKMTELLENNMRSIWNEIYKEDMFLHSSPHDFFDFEFFMMPHKIYQPEEFKETGDILKSKFRIDNEDSVFPKVESMNVPIDGLPMYIENCWEWIKEQKELNLPGEKKMVATYRCGEIKLESIDAVQDRLQDLQKRALDGIIGDYKDQCKDILKIAFTHYNEYARQYHAETYKSVKLELTNHIVDLLYKSYSNQLKNLALQGDVKFSKALKIWFTENTITDTFTETCQNFYDDTMKQFTDNAELLMMEGSNWEEVIKITSKDLGNSLVKMIETEREKQKEKLFIFSLETIVDELEEAITQPIKNLDDNFWDTIIESYKETVNREEDKVKAILNDGFKTLDEEYDGFLSKLEDKVYNNCKKIIVKTVSDINSHMNRKFNSFFKKDDKGKNRDWKNIPEEEIGKLHSECMGHFNSVLEQFKKIEIPKYVSMQIPTMSGSFHTSKETLLSPDDITHIKDKFEQDCEHAFEEAIRLHHNVYSTGIPIYFWALFVFFAYDDILKWLASPILFYPLVFCALVAALMQSLGLLMPAVQAAKVTFNIAYAQMQNKSRK